MTKKKPTIHKNMKLKFKVNSGCWKNKAVGSDKIVIEMLWTWNDLEIDKVTLLKW